ncbi:F-box protein FBW2 [Heracleum sosnowskyi]|uniref:F-box protein FBW2 n=1 Tax=Heracleum sosnowskyi TaxID=360622 RepID=A0AAD8JLI8_9APIA|nr:F-box protein FBW2 [Heracleum sosnowskyi]
MDEGCDVRCWDELLPDALGLIFDNLSLQEVLTVVPRVCKSWQRAVMGPYCWQEIDIEEWSRYQRHENIDRMLQMLIRRSCGSLRKLCVSGLSSDQMFCFISVHAKSLQTLRISRSMISDSIMKQVAGKFSSITALDLSYCINIGATGLEAIGKHCQFLSKLRRIMHPLEVIGKISQDDEALAIAATMPKLEHLEIAYLLVSTYSVIEIITNCRLLKLLDVRGCWNVTLDEKLVKSFPGLKVIGPLVVDHCPEVSSWDACSDYSSSSGYLAWDFVAGDTDNYSDGFSEDEQSINNVEMRFYDGPDVDAGFDWPQSP